MLTRSHPGSCLGSTAVFAALAGALSFAITDPHAPVRALRLCGSQPAWKQQQ
ncbi:hypothetical protein N9L76_00430 [bacterium]|nr:hypothetical protein [bacterium]